MPVYRTPDGKIVEEKTQISRPSSSPGSSSEAPTTLDPSTTRDASSSGDSRYDAKTVVAGRTPAPQSEESKSSPNPSEAESPADSAAADNRTRLVGAGKPSGAADQQSPPLSGDPVTGWLVVVDGPGRGAFAPIGVGRNSIGRSPTERVSMNFGDDSISREAHLVIVYDHRGRRFFVQPGQSQNLSYVDGNPILETAPLESGAELQFGDTTARFVAFCGDDFDWSAD